MCIFAPALARVTLRRRKEKAFVLVLCRICPNSPVRRIIDTDAFCSFEYVSVIDPGISQSMDKVQRFLFWQVGQNLYT